MFSMRTVLAVLFLLIFSIFPVSGKFENVDENLSSRLNAMEGKISEQDKLVADLEANFAHQKEELAKQANKIVDQDSVVAELATNIKDHGKLIETHRRAMANQELHLENQEKLIAAQKDKLADHETRLSSQEKVIANQERLISTLTIQLNKYAQENVDEISVQGNSPKIFGDPSLEDRVNYLEEVAKIKVLRTCAEMEQHGIKKSGFYHLDPDGDNVGNPPIRAYCDFENHVTEILHDALDEPVDISHCDTNLCFERNLTYSAQMEQITSLMSLSTFCDQTIEFDCFMAPLFYNEIQLGVWTDRHGEDQIYFDGENYGYHVCSCNHYNNCTDHEFLHNTCNCDNMAVPDWMEDFGKLTNMTALPVMAFKYGPLKYETQEAKFRVGRLRCGGMKEADNVPHTCKDLKLLGETRPGLYHLQDEDHGDYPKMSFCQLDRPGYEEDMELESHWVKLSSGPGQVYFAVKHNGDNDINNGAVITFDETILNVGDGMNSGSGIFTAPMSGTYSFKLSGLAYVGTGRTTVHIFLNDELKLYMQDDNSYGFNSVSRAWLFDLKQGDQVKLVKNQGGFVGDTHGLYFIGSLI